MYQKIAYYWIFALAWHHGNDVNALKLTPVQQLTQRIDLSSESQSSYLAMNNALKKKQQFLQFIIDDELYSMPYDDSTLFQNFKDLMSTSEFQKIQLTIKRWNLIEGKLRHAISLGNPGQIQAFEDIVHNIASSKVLLGHTLLLTGPEGDSEALSYLDTSCPVILNYAASWRSIDTDGWLDCFVSLRYLYTKNSMGGDLQQLETTLTEKLPWLLSVISNGDSKSDSLLSQLSLLSRKDRKVLSMELKNSWTLIESIRESFKILVEDFMNSNSARIRLGTLTKAQQVTDEILEHFAKSTAVTERDAAAYIADSSAIDIVVLRNKLHNEIKRETWTYLFVMNGVVDSGESFVKDLRSLLDSGSGDWNSVLSSGSSLATDYGAYDFERKTIGFIDIDAILRIFEVALDAVQVRDAALLSSHPAAVKENVVDDSTSKQSSQHSSTTKNKQQKQRRSSTTTNKKTSTRSSRPNTATKQSSREAPEPALPNHRKRSEWGHMWDSIVSFTSFGSLIFIVIAAIGGHLCKSLKQPLKGNRSGYRYQTQLNSSKTVIQNILKTVGLLKYIVCWLRGHLVLYSNHSNSSSAQIYVSLSNTQGSSDEHDSYLPISIISIIIEDILIFVHEVRRGIVRIVKKIPSSAFVFKLSSKAVSLEKVHHSKNLVIDCDLKSSSASAHSPPSPIAIATTSPGSSSSRQQEHFPSEDSQSSTSGSALNIYNKAKPSGKKKNNKSGSTDTASVSVSSQNEVIIEPSNQGDFESSDTKPETDGKIANSVRVQNKSSKGKAKKSSASIKKRATQSISVNAAPLVEDPSTEKPEADVHDESAENKVLDVDAQVSILEVDQEPKTPALIDETVSSIQPDVFISVANEEWDDTDGEWISASGSQVKNSKALNGGFETVKDKQSTKASKLCRQQLMRKREEEAYLTSPRSKPAIKAKEKDKSPSNVRAVSVATSKTVEPVVKNPTVQQSDDKLTVPATDGSKLGYSAVLIKNIPLSMRMAEPAVPLELPSSSGNCGPVTASIHNSKRVGGQKFRSGGASPSVNHRNQGRASPRSKPNSITSTSTTATTVADEEHGTLSDSETSNATMNQISDDSPGQFPVNVMPAAGFPIMGLYPYTAPNLLSPEELMQYNMNSMMMGYYPPHFGGQAHIPMAMPMAWPCVPELNIPFHPSSPSQQYFAPLKPEVQGDENAANHNVDPSGMMFPSIPLGLLGVNQPPFYGSAPMPMYGLDLFPTDGSPAVDILPPGQRMYVNRSRESSPTGILPPHSPLNHDDLLTAIRVQIEYYFSAVNLKHDSYLRGLMDSDGFVSLGPIVSFNRIKSFRASCQQILEAVHSSTLLEVRVLAEAQDAVDGKAAIASLPDSIVLATRIRGIDNPLA